MHVQWENKTRSSAIAGRKQTGKHFKILHNRLFRWCRKRAVWRGRRIVSGAAVYPVDGLAAAQGICHLRGGDSPAFHCFRNFVFHAGCTGYFLCLALSCRRIDWRIFLREAVSQSAHPPSAAGVWTADSLWWNSRTAQHLTGVARRNAASNSPCSQETTSFHLCFGIFYPQPA